MPGELGAGVLDLPRGWLTGLLFMLARMSSVLALVPLPGFRSAGAVPRIVLAAGLTAATSPRWLASHPGLGQLGLWDLVGEILLGLVAGFVVGWLQEAFSMAMQLLGAQAGFSYASTIDPTSQAESTVLPTIAQLASGVLLFAGGLDREVIRALAWSWDTYPPGTFVLHGDMAKVLVAWSGGAVVLALRLALPMITLLLMTDLVMALLSRMQASLQLLSVAFPLKLVMALLLVSALMPTFVSLYSRTSQQAVGVLSESLQLAPHGP
jgi:flagellar biosynthetic protein FliR